MAKLSNEINEKINFCRDFHSVQPFKFIYEENDAFDPKFGCKLLFDQTSLVKNN